MHRSLAGTCLLCRQTEASFSLIFMQMGFVLGLGFALFVGLGLGFRSGIFTQDKSVVHIISIGIRYQSLIKHLHNVLHSLLKVVTGRRDRAKPLPFKMQSTGPWGFSGANEGNPRISTKFVAPCYYINKVEIDTKLPVVGDRKWLIWICSFNVPMAPGKTRSIVCSALNFSQLTMPGPKWWQVVPRWHLHWTLNKVYDGDMIVLQGQEKIFLSKSKDGGGDVNKEYTNITFTPTQADRFVLAFRNWLQRHGYSQPEWFGAANDQQTLPSITLSKRQMLDRFEQHTLKCSSCKSPHSSFQTLQKFLISTAVVCAATAGIPPDMQFRIILEAVSILSAGFAYAVYELQKNFVFVDYVHAEMD